MENGRAGESWERLLEQLQALASQLHLSREDPGDVAAGGGLLDGGGRSKDTDDREIAGLLGQNTGR